MIKIVTQDFRLAVGIAVDVVRDRFIVGRPHEVHDEDETAGRNVCLEFGP